MVHEDLVWANWMLVPPRRDLRERGSRVLLTAGRAKARAAKKP